MTESEGMSEKKDGYKKTRLGLIPKEWEYKKIRNVSDYVDYRGKTPAKTEGGIFLVTASNIKDGYIDYKCSQEYVGAEEYDEVMSRGLPNEGDVLITTEAPLGSVAQIDNERVALAQRVIKYRFDEGKILNDFAKHIFLSYGFQKELFREATGSTVLGIKGSRLHNIKIPIPTKKEQKIIVEVLSSWDEAISKTEKLIKAKKRYKKGLMQRLLSGKVRFPEFEGEDWVEVKLVKLFDRITEKNESESVKNVLTISAQVGLVSQTDYYNKSVASKDLTNYIVLKKGDFAYNKSYSEGYPLGAIKRLDDYEQGVLSPLYICFKLTSDKVDSDFITHFFEYGGLDHGIYKIAREGARNHGLLNVSVKDFFEIDITLPQHEEQKKIASVLNEALKEIELLEIQLEKYQEQKKGLMQQLLTGKVRVKSE